MRVPLGCGRMIGPPHMRRPQGLLLKEVTLNRMLKTGQLADRQPHVARIPWIDTAKALAIIFVFYYHAIDPLIYKGFPHGLQEGRFLASFTLPLFFFLSGLVERERQSDFRTYFLQQVSTLLIPVLFFNIVSFGLLVVTRLVYTGPLVLEAKMTLLERFVLLFGAGIPVFNAPTWFLTCLFSVKIMNRLLRPYTRTTGSIAVSMVIFSIVGYLIAPVFERQEMVVKLMRYFWFFPSALTALVFFQAGMLMNHARMPKWIVAHKGIAIMGFLLFSVIVYQTYNLNQGVYSGYWKAFYLNQMNFGNYFLFYLTSCSGILMMVCLSAILPSYAIIVFCGKNTLALLGFNGVFLHFINHTLAQGIMNHLNGINHAMFILISAALAIAQVMLCLPFIGKVNKFLRGLSSLAMKQVSRETSQSGVGFKKWSED